MHKFNFLSAFFQVFPKFFGLISLSIPYPTGMEEPDILQECVHSLTLFTLTSVCIFSILFPIHFLRAEEEEFASVDNHVLL